MNREEAKEIAAFVLREIRKQSYPYTSDGRFDAGKGSVGKFKYGEMRPMTTPPTVSGIEWEDILPQAIQGYQHDITFTATDWDTISIGTGGTIKFYDGTSQTINYILVDGATTYDLPDSAIRYVYFDLADSRPDVLKVTTSYVSVMTENTGELCLTQRGSESGVKASIIPSYGKQPLLTPDIIDMTGVKGFTYADGTHIQSLFHTQIQAGYILLSAETRYASETYNVAGKEMQVYRGTTAPSDVSKLWLDTSRTPNVWKRYDGSSWVPATPQTLSEIDDDAYFSRIKTTDIYAGHIKLESVIDGGGYQKYTIDEYSKLLGIAPGADVTDGHSLSVLSDRHLGFIADYGDRYAVNSAEKSGAVEASRVLISKLTAYGLSFFTSTSNQRVELDLNGLRSYDASYVKQFEISASTGKVYAANGSVILDVDGIKIRGKGSSIGLARFQNSSGENRGSIYGDDGAYDLVVTGTGAINIRLHSDGVVYLTTLLDLNYDSLGRGRLRLPVGYNKY